MEISIVNVENAPPGCLLSLSPNGASKRQAPLVPRQKFAWRAAGTGGSLKVDVISVLGSTQLCAEELCASGSGAPSSCDLMIKLDQTVTMRLGLSIRTGAQKHRPASPLGTKAALADSRPKKMEEDASGMTQRYQDAEKECAVLREQLRAEQLKVEQAAPILRELLTMRDERNKWKDECSKLQLELACLKVQPANSKDYCSALEQEVARLKDLHATSQRECHTLQDELAQLKDASVEPGAQRLQELSELCESLHLALADNRDKLQSEERRVQERDEELKALHQELKRVSVSVDQEHFSDRRNSWPSACEPKTGVLRPPTASASRGCRLQPEPDAEASRPPTATLQRPAATHPLRQLEAHPTRQRSTSSASLEPEGEMSRPSTASMWPGIAENSYEPEAEASRPTSSASFRRPMSATTWSSRPLSATSESGTIRPMSAAGSRGCSRSKVWSGRVNPRWDTAEFLRSEALILGEAKETEMVFSNTVPVVLEEGDFQSPSARGSSTADDDMDTAHEDSLDVDVDRGPLLDSSCQEFAGSIGRALRKGGNSTACLVNHLEPARSKAASSSVVQEDELSLGSSVHEADLTPSSSPSTSSGTSARSARAKAFTVESDRSMMISQATSPSSPHCTQQVLTDDTACMVPEMQTQSKYLGSIGVNSSASTFEEHEAADESCSHHLSELLSITTSTEAMMLSQSMDLMSPAGAHGEFSDSTLSNARNQESTLLDSSLLTDVTISDSALLAANLCVQDLVGESPPPIVDRLLSRYQADQEESFTELDQDLHTAEEIHTAEEGTIQKAQQQQVAQEADEDARYRAEEEANWNAIMQENEKFPCWYAKNLLVSSLGVEGSAAEQAVEAPFAGASEPHSRCQANKEESHSGPHEELQAEPGTMQKAQQKLPQEADVDVRYKAEANQSSQQEACIKAEDEQKWGTSMQRNLERRGAQDEGSKKEIQDGQAGNLLLAVKLRKKAQQDASSTDQKEEKEKKTRCSDKGSQGEVQQKHALEKGLKETEYINEEAELKARPKTQQKKQTHFAAEAREKDEAREEARQENRQRAPWRSPQAREEARQENRQRAPWRSAQAREEAQQENRQRTRQILNAVYSKLVSFTDFQKVHKSQPEVIFTEAEVLAAENNMLSKTETEAAMLEQENAEFHTINALSLEENVALRAELAVLGVPSHSVSGECWGDSMPYADDSFSLDWWGYNAWVPRDAVAGGLPLEAELNETCQLRSQLYYSGEAKLEMLHHLLEQGQIAAGLPLSRISESQSASSA